MFTLKRIALVGAAGLAAFSISCSDDDGDDSPDTRPLVKHEGIVLSYEGSSYGDLDTNPPTTLGQTAALSAANKTKIDLVAYNVSDADDRIYTPLDEPGDLFYADEAPYAYEGGPVGFWLLPAGSAAVLEAAETMADISGLQDELEAIVDTEDVDFVNIVPGTAFLVSTTNGALVAVVITAGGTAQSVTLSTAKFPAE